MTLPGLIPTPGLLNAGTSIPPTFRYIGWSYASGGNQGSFGVTLTDEEQSVILLGGIASNGGGSAQWSSLSCGGVGGSAVATGSRGLGTEYSSYYGIYVCNNVSSGSQTVSFNKSNSTGDYSSVCIAYAVSHAFDDVSATDSFITFGTSPSGSLDIEDGGIACGFVLGREYNSRSLSYFTTQHSVEPAVHEPGMIGGIIATTEDTTQSISANAGSEALNINLGGLLCVSWGKDKFA